MFVETNHFSLWLYSTIYNSHSFLSTRKKTTLNHPIRTVITHRLFSSKRLRIRFFAWFLTCNNISSTFKKGYAKKKVYRTYKIPNDEILVVFVLTFFLKLTPVTDVVIHFICLVLGFFLTSLVAFLKNLVLNIPLETIKFRQCNISNSKIKF